MKARAGTLAPRKRRRMTAAANLLRSYRIGAARLGVPTEEYVAHREAGERWCSRCKRWLAEALLEAYAPRCLACGAEYRRERAAKSARPRANAAGPSITPEPSSIQDRSEPR